ncbi:MAG TPA: hypothetical protein VG673_20610 [Actinomycetota bacterium]|nr:hypothetical protein [Actinomycetota bacterium]
MSMTGAWRIVEMDLWDAEAIDLLGPGYIQFGADRTGRFRFIAVEGWMDCHSGPRDGRPCVEFTWEGNDESDPASGRGWAALEEDGSLRGHIYFHLGDAPASGQCVPRMRRSPRRRATQGAETPWEASLSARRCRWTWLKRACWHRAGKDGSAAASNNRTRPGGWLHPGHATRATRSDENS